MSAFFCEYTERPNIEKSTLLQPSYDLFSAHNATLVNRAYPDGENFDASTSTSFAYIEISLSLQAGLLRTECDGCRLVLHSLSIK
jgi:hypothetical protein